MFLRILSGGGGDVQTVVVDPENPNNFFVVQYGHDEIEYTIDMGFTGHELYSGYYNNVPPYQVKPPIIFFKPNGLAPLKSDNLNLKFQK
ncbi:MAG: hypothetical protein Kow00127_12300 [Bacteroidales bacterium]